MEESGRFMASTSSRKCHDPMEVVERCLIQNENEKCLQMTK